MIQKLLSFGRNNSPTGTIEFKMIGYRDSGKTTYLAALAYWPISLKSDTSPIDKVEPYDSNTEVLINMAENILRQGDQLPSTEEPSLYSITVELKQNFVDKLTGKPANIRISCTDYPGELFKDIRTNATIVNSYLDNLQSATGLILLIDGTTSKTDEDYSKGIQQLETKLNQRLANTPNRLKNYRVAVVISKAELPELWGSLDNLPDFINRKFPYTQKALDSWKKEWKCQIEYFSCSAFGWMGTRNEPNVKVIQKGGGATLAVIADSNAWKPGGLVQPIFWLKTGYRHQQLKRQHL
ncbi:MAG: hypothetical protein MK289_22895 [Trichodesmium sp. ALOHA_ZT_67]|nr:hypothetical protein [Trichodesmium sp. ALOHA_ZT_67]